MQTNKNTNQTDNQLIAVTNALLADLGLDTQFDSMLGILKNGSSICVGILEGLLQKHISGTFLEILMFVC